MSTFSLFKTDVPVVVKGVPSSFSESRIVIMRPSKFSNPFPSGRPITKFQLISIFNNTVGLPADDEILLKYFPMAMKYVKRCGLLSRSECLECFREYWSYIRQHGVITDAEVLALSGKTLVCNCKPKACHGDVIVDDFKAIKLGLR